MTLTDAIRGMRRFSPWDALHASNRSGAVLIVVLHLGALAVMFATEFDWFATALFLLTWGLLNGMFLLLVCRPAVAAALSLGLIALLIVLSIFKSWAIWTTLNFFDFLIVNSDTAAFLLGMYPELRTIVIAGVAITIPLLIVIWRIDPFRIRRVYAAVLAAGCLAATVALSLARPEQPSDSFQGINHLSNFSRSGVLAVAELMTKGWIELDATPDRLALAGNEPCRTAGKRPHIVMVLDEASFDITAVPGIKVPPGYAGHFQSFDGKVRKFVVEGTGGPTWYTEYNVLTGLSARSYGGLKFYVTRIAANRVERGLPQALRRCGYQTYSLYPAYGAFLNAKRFQATTGVERFIDMEEMRASFVEPDRFYYDQALRVLKDDRNDKPKFVFVYTVANHFPWHERYRPGDTPEWRDLGNEPEVDEYIRRQTMSARDYKDFIARLKRDFPKEAFLVVRFGDHQPSFSRQIIEPSLDDGEVGRLLAAHDPRYFTTYYSIDPVNFAPRDLSSAFDSLEAPYLPLVIQEAAGLPLDPSFAEQKKILQRCQGTFYLCAGGAEARRFNRLLVDAGLIKGMVSR
jgi:hypothetical protein